eukprot:1157331-Pelagomonas_calceolata.AAC.6
MGYKHVAQHALHVLRMKHEMGAIRLHWAANRPPSHYTRESRGMTAKQQALKDHGEAMCRTMVRRCAGPWYAACPGPPSAND